MHGILRNVYGQTFEICEVKGYIFDVLYDHKFIMILNISQLYNHNQVPRYQLRSL